MSAGRALIFGPGGSGKTITAMLLATGLSKERHNSAPIALIDPEGIEEFVRPICEAEGIPLIVEPTHAFVDMRDALKAAEDAGCCAFVVDHYDGIHRELTEAQKRKLNLGGHRLPYQHREDLIRLWDDWVRLFRASPLHCVFTGRLAWEWGDDEDESGDPIKVKLAPKARGDADATYEPNLLIEMERIDTFVRHKASRSRKGAIKHVARVLKDRRMVLNGLSFSWDDLNGYQAGDYQKVWTALSPHFVATPPAGPRLLHRTGAPRGSDALFSAPAGESSLAERTRRVTIAIEEIQGALTAVWSGSTNEEKRFKSIVLETMFQTRSWTKIETFLPERLESAVAMMKLFEDAARDPENSIRDEASVIALIANCRDTQVASERASLENAVM